MPEARRRPSPPTTERILKQNSVVADLVRTEFDPKEFERVFAMARVIDETPLTLPLKRITLGVMIGDKDPDYSRKETIALGIDEALHVALRRKLTAAVPRKKLVQISHAIDKELSILDYLEGQEPPKQKKEKGVQENEDDELPESIGMNQKFLALSPEDQKIVQLRHRKNIPSYADIASILLEKFGLKLAPRGVLKRIRELNKMGLVTMKQPINLRKRPKK